MSPGLKDVSSSLENLDSMRRCLRSSEASGSDNLLYTNKNEALNLLEHSQWSWETLDREWTGKGFILNFVLE